MYQVSQRRANSTAVAHFLLSFVTAPLLTISTSLQISVQQNKVRLIDINPTHEAIQSKNKFNVTTSRLNLGNRESAGEMPKKSLLSRITPTQNKQEVVKANRSLGLWQPFKPAVYSSYQEAVQGLYRQGSPYAFYKGNVPRSLHVLLFHKTNAMVNFKLEKNPLWKELKK